MADDINQEQEKTQEAQIEGQYAALGKFIQEFSQICHTLRISFSHLIQGEGLKDFQVGQIIINNKVITAAPLLEIMEALVGYLKKDDAIGLEIFSHTKVRFRSLIEKRNEITHGSWFIGQQNAEEKDSSEISAHILKTNKKGIKVKTILKSEQEILTLVEECKQVENLFFQFFLTIYLGNQLSEKFTKDSKGKWWPLSPDSEENSKS